MVLCGLAILVCTWLCAADEKEIGLRVGDNIPDFRASDQSDKTRAFKNLCGPKGLLFIFHRSAGW